MMPKFLQVSPETTFSAPDIDRLPAWGRARDQEIDRGEIASEKILASATRIYCTPSSPRLDDEAIK
jgi:hypothetical protein